MESSLVRKWKVNIMLAKRTSEFQAMLAEIQKLGGIGTEELRDAIIALRLVNNIETYALPINVIKFVEELKHFNILILCQILEKQM